MTAKVPVSPRYVLGSLIFGLGWGLPRAVFPLIGSGVVSMLVVLTFALLPAWGMPQSHVGRWWVYKPVTLWTVNNLIRVLKVSQVEGRDEGCSALSIRDLPLDFQVKATHIPSPRYA